MNEQMRKLDIIFSAGYVSTYFGPVAIWHTSKTVRLYVNLVPESYSMFFRSQCFLLVQCFIQGRVFPFLTSAMQGGVLGKALDP